MQKLPDGRHVRSLGRTQEGKAPRFYLGRDPREARIREAHLETVWEECTKVQDGNDPRWKEEYFEIAKATADGTTARLNWNNPDHEAHAHVSYLDSLRALFPWVPIEIKNFEVEQAGRSQLKEQGAKLLNELKPMKAAIRLQEATARELMGKTSTNTLHAALDGLKEWFKSHYATPDGTLKDSYYTHCNSVEFIKFAIPDMSLSRLNTKQINDIMLTLSKRPKGKRGKPVAVLSAKGHMKEFRRFIDWLHYDSGLGWKKPEDFRFRPQKVEHTSEELQNGGEVPTYSIEELKVLYQYARPWDRAVMLVGLNCGFALAESGTLTWNEIKTDNGDTFVKRVRRKSKVAGVWKLWPETVQALNWIKVHRPSPDLVFRNKKGTPLKIVGIRNNNIANKWERLLSVIQKDYPEFRDLSFGKLRKTSADQIRQEHGDELASLFLAHGKPEADPLLPNYTNPRFKKLATVLDWLRGQYQEVFATVCDPFPAEESYGGNHVSRKTTEQIQELRKQGKKYREIREITGLSFDTIRRHSKPTKKAPEPQ